MWCGILIAAGIAISAGLYRIIRLEKKHGEINQRNDELNLVACTMICTLSALSLFVHQNLVTYVIEALIMGNLWITMYFSYLTVTHLRYLPSLARKEQQENIRNQR